MTVTFQNAVLGLLSSVSVEEPGALEDAVSADILSGNSFQQWFYCRRFPSWLPAVLTSLVQVIQIAFLCVRDKTESVDWPG